MEQPKLNIDSSGSEVRACWRIGVSAYKRRFTKRAQRSEKVRKVLMGFEYAMELDFARFGEVCISFVTSSDLRGLRVNLSYADTPLRRQVLPFHLSLLANLWSPSLNISRKKWASEKRSSFRPCRTMIIFIEGTINIR